MLVLDVNVLLVAHRPDGHPAGDDVRDWVSGRLTAVERVGVDTQVLAAVVRIATNAHVYESPSSTSAALAFCDSVLGAPSAVTVAPSSRHWSLFASYVQELRLTGNDVTDAYLAALAMDHEATFVSLDKGFRRFPGLHLVNPLAG